MKVIIALTGGVVNSVHEDNYENRQQLGVDWADKWNSPHDVLNNLEHFGHFESGDDELVIVDVIR